MGWLDRQIRLQARDSGPQVRDRLDRWVTESHRSRTAAWNSFRVYRHPEGHYIFRCPSAGIGDLAEPMPRMTLRGNDHGFTLETRPEGSLIGSLIGIAVGIDVGLLMALYSTRGTISLDLYTLLALILIPLLSAGGLGAWLVRKLRGNSEKMTDALTQDLQLERLHDSFPP